VTSRVVLPLVGFQLGEEGGLDKEKKVRINRRRYKLGRRI